MAETGVGHVCWRQVTLPDGRRVEYVDAVPVEQVGENLFCDVTVLIDGKMSGPVRVVVSVGAGEQG